MAKVAEMSKDELLSAAKDYKLDVKANTPIGELREQVERASIRRTLQIEAEESEKLRKKAEIDNAIEEIKYEAEKLDVKIKIPPKPTMADVVRLRDKLNIVKTEPKPSPEDIAIEKSKKVYAIFHNLKHAEADETFLLGSKYVFHLWDNRIHCLPQFLLDHCRQQCVHRQMGRQKDQLTGEEKSVVVSTRPLFSFDVLDDAPKDADFGVILDEDVLKKLMPENALAKG